MIKPKQLKPGDKVAIVSLSWGGLGDAELIHKFTLGKQRLEDEFGLQVIAMPHALKGTEFVYHHPELRAKDLMQAFEDPSIQGIICAIGGSDTIRILPYIEYDIIRANPKVFMGFSDTTANHLMLWKAGIVSFYGPCLMCDFAEYGSMFEYTKEYIKKTLFEHYDRLEILPSPVWTDETIPWLEENLHKNKRLITDNTGYECLQGSGTVTGTLLGGCIDAFMLYNGTSIWPSKAEFSGTILFLETSEDYPSCDLLTWLLRNLMAQGIFDVIHGIVFAKPMDGKYYEEYKEVLRNVIGVEAQHPELPILYNLNFGHSTPRCILPYGVQAEINCERKTFALIEAATVEN
jgi:muramoyltetrapeptide carboxypeptidase LdcA involved in peptidoglycan recycling